MCDCLVALNVATGGATLFAKNSDRPPSEAHDVIWSPPRRDADPIDVTHIAIAPFPSDTLGCLLSRPRWCWGAEHGVNEAGVAIGNEAIYTTLDPRPFPDALIGMDLVRLGLERSLTARAAVEVITGLLERYGQGGSGHDPAGGKAKPYWSSFLIADPEEAWVLETSGVAWMAAHVDDVRAISNRTTIPTFDARYRHPNQPVERLVDPRLAASNEVLSFDPVIIDDLFDHLRSHESCAEPGWSVCMHVDGVEETTASMVAELPADGPPVAHVLVGSPCLNEYVRVEIGRPFEAIRWENRRVPAAAGAPIE